MSSSMTIPYRPSLSVRVVYEPDGTPLYCGKDVAEILGYRAPIKAVQRAEGVTLYRRTVRWNSPKDSHRHSAQVLCLDKPGVCKLARIRMDGSRDAAQWVMSVLFRKAEDERPPLSEIVPQPKPKAEAEPPAPILSEQATVFDVRGFGAKLDAIIAQCVMTKAQLEQMSTVQTEPMN